MNQPGKWWLGLVPLIVLWIFANVSKTPIVEADLRVRALIAAQRGSGNLLDKPSVAVAGRDVTLAGSAFTPQAQASGVAAAESAFGVRLVDSKIQQIPEKKPYELSVARVNGQIVVRGSAPLPAVKTKLIDTVRAAYRGAKVVDEITYASGAPAGLESLVAFGVGVVSKLRDGSFSLSDSALSLSGVAATSEIYLNSLTDLRQLPRGGTLAKVEILPPEIKPYICNATSYGRSLALTGLAPKLEIRELILARAASLFGGAGNRRMELARGAPAGDYAALVIFALSELARLSEGKVEIVDGVLSLSGIGKVNVTAATIEAELKAGLPSGFKLGKIDITDGAIAPYGFTASKQDGTLVLSGHIPDDKIRGEINDIVAKKYFDTKIDDRLAIGRGAPDGFGAAVSAIVTGMARLAAGTASLSDRRVSLRGEAFYQKAIEPILAAMRSGLPAGFQQDTTNVAVKDAGPPLDNAACQPALQGILSRGRILFETGSTNIDSDSAAILDTLVSVTNRCANAAVEIGGHTDSVGSDEANMNLSKRRADAVHAYLVEAGVDAARLSTEGYGESKPVASNDSEDGRAQNRRIEFLVKQEPRP
jgi:OOP family OmpA-OmpF porin